MSRADYLGGGVTPSQKFLFEQATDRLEATLNGSPVADSYLIGAADYVKRGAPTLTALRDEIAGVHAEWATLQEQLRGAVVAAVEAGAPVTDVALEAGVTRQTVYAWNGK